jgi:hypothetical protein
MELRQKEPPLSSSTLDIQSIKKAYLDHNTSKGVDVAFKGRMLADTDYELRGSPAYSSMAASLSKI